MNYRHLTIALFLSLVFLWPVSAVQAQVNTDDTEYRKLLMELIVTLQEQIRLLQQGPSETSVSASSTDVEVEDLPDFIEATHEYSIKTPADVEQIKNINHRRYLERVFALFPDEFDDKLKRFIIFSNDEDHQVDLNAFVQTLPPEHNSWLYAASEEDVLEDYELIDEVIVHELAHIISYEEAISSNHFQNIQCEDYFDNPGCPSANSYLRKYVDEFWSEKNLKRAEDLTYSEDLFRNINSYYRKNQNNYVSDYATISPEEDFAETFMFFVFDLDVKGGTVADDKINFFSRFSKFLEVKKEIISNF